MDQAFNGGMIMLRFVALLAGIVSLACAPDTSPLSPEMPNDDPRDVTGVALVVGPDTIQLGTECAFPKGFVAAPLKAGRP